MKKTRILAIWLSVLSLAGSTSVRTVHARWNGWLDIPDREPPMAQDDAYTTKQDTPLYVPAPGVLANDRDPQGIGLMAFLATGPSHGTVMLKGDGSFTYTPHAGFAGTDTFVYWADNLQGQIESATVTIKVLPPTDLYDDGEDYCGFEPRTVGGGDQFELWCDVRNGGPGDSGEFSVEFFASIDTHIGSTDHYIGRESMWSIAAGDYATCRWRGSFPTDIPAGTYWVGWVIDADDEVQETDEHNNTAYKHGYQLTVGTSRVGGPVAHWKLDESSGSTAYDSAGHNHGTTDGGPVWLPAGGMMDGALSFDGVDDYVGLPIGSVINSLTNCTFATWVDFANTGGPWQRIFDFGNNTTSYMFLTPRLSTAGEMRFGITVAGGGSP
ncbi:MAG: cadherin-like domain-containing protein, partial [Phycisphaerales bacterium]